MIVISELAAQDLPEIAQLIREQISGMPPFVTPRHDEVLSILRDPTHQMRAWYPEEHTTASRTPCWVARSGERVAAAMQLQLTAGEPDAYLYWLVGRQECQDEIAALVNWVIGHLRSEGRSLLRSHRNPFGPGWEGIADTWGHLLTPLRQAAGQMVSDPWILYSCSAVDLRPTEMPAGYACDVLPNPRERSVALHVREGDRPLAEAELRLPPAANTSFVQAGVADLEWIEVDEAERRRGVGRVMLTQAMREAARHGFPTIVLWVETENLAMQALVRACGFTRGPILHWLTLNLGPGQA